MNQHVSHQNGLDVDVYYPRRDRQLSAVHASSQIDRDLAQDLLDRFVAAGARMVFVGCSTWLRGPDGVVVPYPNHENHMHVRFPASRLKPGSDGHARSPGRLEPGGPVLSRTTSFVGRIIRRGFRGCGPTISSSSHSAASRPFSSCGWAIVVSGGLVSAPQGRRRSRRQRCLRARGSSSRGLKRAGREDVAHRQDRGRRSIAGE